MERFSYDFIFNNVESGIVAIDKDFIVNNCNKVAGDTLKTAPADVIGKKCVDVLKCLGCPLNCPAVKAIRKGGTCNQVRLLIKDCAGMTVPIRLSSIPIKDDAENEVIGAILMFSDEKDLYPPFLVNFQRMGLIGISPQIREVFHLIEMVAATNSNVMISGETGTGKELVANAIHQLSTRAEKPFVKVNCAALSDSLLESELFGHEKGAFTGASTKRTGRFETANGGTIFLDEISEISPNFQAKLLRVLQEGEFERVGSSTSIRVDVRIIAATNKDLFDLVKQKRFRDDLFYRINVFPIHIAPLRERKDDIRLLVEYFINEFNKFFDKQKLHISDEALEILSGYDLPGNIREIKNIIEYAFVKSPDSIIEKTSLPHYLLKQSGEDDVSLKKLARGNEFHHILQALNECQGNKTLAARKLKISRKTLYNKLRSRVV